MGVRGGVSAAPRARKVPGQTLFSGQAQVAQKSWMIKNTYSIQWKNSRATLFFRASASCSKILNNKKYIFRTVNWGHPLFFRACACCSKILNGKRYIRYSENFQGKLCFQGKRKLLKIVNVKSIFNTVKIFRASTSCSKIVNGEKIFNTVYIHLGVIRVIWASVVCNLDQRREWL